MMCCEGEGKNNLTLICECLVFDVQSLKAIAVHAITIEDLHART